MAMLEQSMKDLSLDEMLEPNNSFFCMNPIDILLFNSFFRP